LKAKATATSITAVAEALSSNGLSGQDAISYSVAEKYVNAFGNLAKEGTTVIVPGNIGDAAGMVTSMMNVFNNIKKSSDSHQELNQYSSKSPITSTKV